MLQILLLSDIHFKKSDREYVEDLAGEMLNAIISNDINVHYIFVVGDIANSGIDEEYEVAIIFFSKLLEKLNLTKDKIFFTAGNHDVEWSQISKEENIFKAQLIEQKEEYKIKELKKKFFEQNSEYMYKKFKNYENFVSNYSLLQTIKKQQTPSIISYNFSYVSKIEDAYIISLNTALLSGNDDGHRKEFFCVEEQLNKIKSDIGENKNIIIIMHHSLYDYIPQMEREEIIDYIKQQKNHIIFCGHYHKPKNEIREVDGIFLKECRLGAFNASDTHALKFSIYSIDFIEEKFKIYDYTKLSIENNAKWELDGSRTDYFYKKADIERVKLTKENSANLISDYDIDFIKFIFGNIHFQYDNLSKLKKYLYSLFCNKDAKEDFIQIAKRSFEIFKNTPFINVLKAYIIDTIVNNSDETNNIAENFVSNKNIMERIPAYIYTSYINKKLLQKTKDYWVGFINKHLNKFPESTKPALIAFLHQKFKEENEYAK